MKFFITANKKFTLLRNSRAELMPSSAYSAAIARSIFTVLRRLYCAHSQLLLPCTENPSSNEFLNLGAHMRVAHDLTGTGRVLL